MENNYKVENFFFFLTTGCKNPLQNEAPFDLMKSELILILKDFISWYVAETLFFTIN